MKVNHKFKFSTKANTLNNLSKILKQSEIPDFIYFTVGEWNNSKNSIIDRIKSKFSELVVIRSSCLNEDSYIESMAGKYESILDVDVKDTELLIESIDLVIKSYLVDGVQNEENQIIVQHQISDVNISGVVFTRDLETGAPYYLVHYDDYSGRTDIITSGTGKQNKVFTYYKFCDVLPSDEYLNQVVECIREIETKTGHDALDIEFVISNNKFYTLQVRPIATLHNLDSFKQRQFADTLENIQRFILETNIKYPNLSGTNVAYGIMPDWNPAEIIGVDPKPLAFSLYRYLITDEIWPMSRAQVGYKNVGYHPGICSIGGKPYVDIRLSFNTFLPSDLDDELSEKLVDFYISKLRRFQDYHDKVEFNIVYTCFWLDFEEIEKELGSNGFSQGEIAVFKKSLFKLTDNILSERVTSIKTEMDSIKNLELRRKKIINSSCSLPVKIAQLAQDCRTYGTLSFSKLARFAFISSTIMRSLLKKSIITKEQYERFFSSINTVATEFLDSLNDLKNNNITLDEFLSEFGHLRPGTYDITSKNYKENFHGYVDLNNYKPLNKSSHVFEFDNLTKLKINDELEKHGFSISVDNLIVFLREAIISREKSKFEFTKNLSLILEYVEKYLSQHNISRDEASYLQISDILNISHSSLDFNYISRLKDKICENSEQYALMKSIKLPPLIFFEKSVYYFRNFDNMPNFITHRSICAEIVDLSSGLKENIVLDGKIVLIENADPGYDWIFSHNIAGLITEFGGAGSHMAIRSSEFKLPAAIGCGAVLFSLIKNSKKIELNCGTKQIKVII